MMEKYSITMNRMRTLNWLAGDPELRVFGPVGDEGRLVAELRSLKSQRSRRAPRVAKGVEILEKTNSARVRNAAALVLAERQRWY
jgi:hypothetical protein